jgi:hypothetical protein
MIRVETKDMFFHGRDGVTSEIDSNIEVIVSRANKLLDALVLAGVALETNDRGTYVASGYRSPAFNASVPGAAVRSNHMKGLAIDIYDPEGAIDDWLMSQRDATGEIPLLADIGLWLEHPGSTKGWCHVQCVPPGSKRRVFYP